MNARDEGLTPQECMARSSARKKRRVAIADQISNKGTIDIVNELIQKESCADEVKCLFKKMITAGLLDDLTEPQVVQCIAANGKQLVQAVRSCISKGDSGFTYIKAIVEESTEDFDKLKATYKSNYTSLTDPESKCIFWTFAAAFLVIYYEFTTDKLFEFPMKTTEEEYREFLLRYPEFLIRTWDSKDLLQFKICMELAVRACGSRSNMGCLVELVTFMMKNREVALCCNTSGGGLREFHRPTEVSTEKCRVLIYHRESGGAPRRRKQLPFHPGSTGGVDNGMRMMDLNSYPMYATPQAMSAAPVPFPSSGAGNTFCWPGPFPAQFNFPPGCLPVIPPPHGFPGSMQMPQFQNQPFHNQYWGYTLPNSGSMASSTMQAVDQAQGQVPQNSNRNWFA